MSVATFLDVRFHQVLDWYDFGNMKLHDVAITPDSQRLLGVGPLLRSPNNLQPSKSRVEKRLVGELHDHSCAYQYHYAEARFLYSVQRGN